MPAWLVPAFARLGRLGTSRSLIGGGRGGVRFRPRISVSVQTDVAEAVRRLGRDVERKALRAAAWSINRVADNVRAEAVREIAAETSIPSRMVRQKIIVRRATPDRLIAEVEAKPYSPNIGLMGGRQTKVGVSAKAWGKRRVYPRTFLNPRGTGKALVREDRERYPLRPIRGPSVRKTFMTERIQQRLYAVIEQRWRPTFERELARRALGGAIATEWVSGEIRVKIGGKVEVL